MHKSMDCFNLRYLKSVNLIIVLSCCLTCYGQKDSIGTKISIWHTFKDDGIFIGKSVGRGLSQPIRWQKDDFITLGAVALGTGLVYLTDEKWNRLFINHNNEIPQGIKDFGWYFGSPQNFFLISGGIYGFGLITKNEKVRHTGVLIIASAATSGIFQSISKTVVGRARPMSGEKNTFKPFSNEGGFHSLPSGHTVLSISMAHAIAKQFKNTWVKIGIYAIGSIAPLSRLWENAHWASDIVLGAALSIAVVDGIDNFMKQKKAYNYSKPKLVNWQLRAGYNTVGFVGTF